MCFATLPEVKELCQSLQMIIIINEVTNKSVNLVISIYVTVNKLIVLLITKEYVGLISDFIINGILSYSDRLVTQRPYRPHRGVTRV